MAHVTMKAFKSALRAKGARDADCSTALLRKAFLGKALDAGDRTIKFTISTNAVDLDNDMVDQAGWDLSVYETNPLVLWMHDSYALPIGKCIAIAVEDGALKAAVEFVPADMPVIGGFAEAVYRMAIMGFLSATSVGFMPLDYEIANDRDDESSWSPPVNFTRQKLLEFSIVTVPANSEALIEPGQQVATPAVQTPVEVSTEASAELAARKAAEGAARQVKSELDAVFRRAGLLARIL